MADLRELRDLGGGVWVSQTALWQTNAVLALARDEALLVDPGFEPAEIAALAAHARSAGGAIHVLITHGDYDHVCGIGYLPEASIVAGPETATRVRSGEAGEQLREAGAEWGFAWPAELRVDRVAEPGSVRCGAFAVEALDARGHTDDGLAYLLVDQRVLVPGDYLSSITYPFLVGDLAACIATHHALLRALDEHDVRWVVPGHGAVLTPTEAKEIGRADLEYLGALSAAATESREQELSRGHALLHVYDVEPPRPNTPDFEVFGLRAFNARAALAGA